MLLCRTWEAHAGWLVGQHIIHVLFLHGVTPTTPHIATLVFQSWQRCAGWVMMPCRAFPGCTVMIRTISAQSKTWFVVLCCNKTNAWSSRTKRLKLPTYLPTYLYSHCNGAPQWSCFNLCFWRCWALAMRGVMDTLRTTSGATLKRCLASASAESLDKLVTSLKFRVSTNVGLGFYGLFKTFRQALSKQPNFQTTSCLPRQSRRWVYSLATHALTDSLGMQTTIL